MILGKLSLVKIFFLLSNDNDDVFSQFRMGSFTKEREKRAISLNVILIGMKRIFSLMIEHIVALKITRCCYYYVLMVFLCYPSLVFHSLLSHIGQQNVASSSCVLHVLHASELIQLAILSPSKQVQCLRSSLSFLVQES